MFGAEISILEGLMIMALGMGVTFVILYFLSLLINLMKVAFYKVQPSSTPEPKNLPQTTLEPTVAATTDSGIDASPVKTGQAELIAAITAAIALTLGVTPKSIAIRKITETGNIQAERPELIAAITAAVALTLNTPLQSISVKSIVKRGNDSPNSSRWHDFGKMAQFDNRL